MGLLQQPEFIVFALATILGSIVWFVRLEGRVNYGEKASEKALATMEVAVALAHKRIDDTKEKHEAMENRIFQEMSSIKVSLAEISGYLRKEKEK